MPDLPPRPDLDQLRRQAKDLLRAAGAGDPSARALRRCRPDDAVIGAASDRPRLRVPELAEFKQEVDRREILDDRDLARLGPCWRRPVAGDTIPGALGRPSERRRTGIHRDAAVRRGGGLGLPSPGRARWRGHCIAAGAPANGWPATRRHRSSPPRATATPTSPGCSSMPAPTSRRRAPDAGGVPGGTALLHAAVFGMTDVVDVLIAAGAMVHGIEEAAAAGDIDGWLTPDTEPGPQSVPSSWPRTISAWTSWTPLVAAGTPVDAVDEAFGRHPLRDGGEDGRADSVRRLLRSARIPTGRRRRTHAARPVPGGARLGGSRRPRRGRGDPGAAHIRGPAHAVFAAGNNPRRRGPA